MPRVGTADDHAPLSAQDKGLGEKSLAPQQVRIIGPWSYLSAPSGLLAFATFPWLLVRDESAAGLGLFIRTYSAFLGPIFAVLVVDYYIIRRQTLNLTHLYDADGPYRGVNPAALIATVIGVVVALIFSGISWYASLIPAGLSYYLLMQYLPAARRFRD